MFETVVCNLDKDGNAVSRFKTEWFERRYQAITVADHYDKILNQISGKRAYGTCIIWHRNHGER